MHAHLLSVHFCADCKNMQKNQRQTSGFVEFIH